MKIREADEFKGETLASVYRRLLQALTSVVGGLVCIQGEAGGTREVTETACWRCNLSLGILKGEMAPLTVNARLSEEDGWDVHSDQRPVLQGLSSK